MSRMWRTHYCLGCDVHTIVSFSVTMASACGREETPLPCAPSSRLSAAPSCSSVTRFVCLLLLLLLFFQAVDGCLCLFPSLFAVQRQTKSPPLDPWDAVRLQQVLFWDDTNLWEFSPIVGHVDVDHARHFSCLLFSCWILVWNAAMDFGEQAVQFFKLVTNCLCSDSHTPVITHLLRLCQDAVTYVSEHLCL